MDRATAVALAARTDAGRPFVLATVVAATAHTLAGGGAPSPLFCAVIAALAVPGATALAGPRPALWRTALAVGGSQVLFHAAFAVTGDLGAWDAGTEHVHGAPLVVAPASASSSAMNPAEHPTSTARSPSSVSTPRACRTTATIFAAFFRRACSSSILAMISE